MICGVGTDIVSIDRINHAVLTFSFIKKHFSLKEQEYFEDKNNNLQTIAGNFAAKEAFSKSLGTGIRGFSLNEISVLRDELGKPYIELAGAAEKIADDLGISRFHVSISNSREYAVAVVIAEKE